MGNASVRRRHSAFAAGLATLAMALGFTSVPAGAAPPEVDYAALGDSYTAGTGAKDAVRPPGVDCWQSHPGYVDIVAATLRANLLDNAACHGAVLSKRSPTYDQVLYTPTVQEQIRSLVKERALSQKTDLISMTAGANDLGFSRVLGVCAFSDEATCRAALAQAESPTALAFLTASLVQTYTTIQVLAPNAKVAVLGYPLLFDPDSPIALPISSANQRLMNGATVTLNATIARAVRIADALPRTDVQYIDVTAAFTGHAVNSVTGSWLQLSPTNFAADYNFHPNDAGHQAYATALLASVNLKQLARP
ncbi:putative Lipase [Arthrobacter sp. 9AX]|uniref:SGNH/GDSL hydrolase family protein n=1 Tax=Arthrobacter sp. 9AX TaxID=2653131 RepID=UPI0012EF06EE|nr:SGNH/GDSL hydrolase family protein [Arthrobacter sp. 9AX]VXB99242.1 putative Lipase [Arthrobacter sp. 9AX]